MNTQKHNIDLKYCVYCGIKNNNQKIGCYRCIKIMMKKRQKEYYLRNRETIIKKQLQRQNAIKNNTKELLLKLSKEETK